MLFGDNPSGKLITFPRSVGQIPTYYNHLRLGRPCTPGTPWGNHSQYFEAQRPAVSVWLRFECNDFQLSAPKLSAERMTPDEDSRQRPLKRTPGHGLAPQPIGAAVPAR